MDISHEETIAAGPALFRLHLKRTYHLHFLLQKLGRNSFSKKSYKDLGILIKKANYKQFRLWECKVIVNTYLYSFLW